MSDDNRELKEIARKLRELRDAEGLNQGQFAKKVGLTQAAISQFEDGKRFPSSKALQKIAAGLGLSIDILLGNGGNNDEQYSEKDAAIQALATTLKNRRDLNKEEIIALNRFFSINSSEKNEEKE
jgi:transcriptional regulator with XRE-family HTH domain